jgi:hypothetical protein
MSVMRNGAPGQGNQSEQSRAAHRNVIVLTAGLAGSSLVAGLIAEAGYWAGDRTIRKTDYDTYENQELVDLNQRLLQEAGYRGKYELVFRAEDIRDVAERTRAVDPAPYRAFIERCERHRPWLWKDPRLWLTLRFWGRLLDTDRISFLLVTREHAQAWISQTIRRQIQTPRYCRNYMGGVRGSFLEFLAENRLEHSELVYEDLLMKPDDAIFRLNAFLGCGITMADLSHACRGRLYRKRHGLVDRMTALAIYAKNYPSRYR